MEHKYVFLSKKCCLKNVIYEDFLTKYEILHRRIILSIFTPTWKTNKRRIEKE